MSAKTSIDLDKISLVSIKTLKGSIEDTSINASDFVFEFDTSTTVQKGRRVLRFLLNTSIKIEVNEKETEVAYFSIEFLFHIDNLDDFVQYNEETKTVNIFVGLGITIASVAYGTVRGIIHTRTQGTILGGIILPIIDTKNLLSSKMAPETEAEPVPKKKKTAPRKRP